MESILYHFILINGYLIALYLIYIGLLKKSNNYHFSRPFLIVGAIASILLPFVEFSSVNIYGATIQFNEVLEEIVISGNTTAKVNSTSWQLLTGYLYLTISFFFLLRFVFRLVQLFKMKSNSVNRNHYFELPKGIQAFSFINWIFIGSELTENERNIVLRHESIHVNRNHSWDILLFQFLEIIFWVNPIVFKFKNLAQELHEFEADENSCQEEEKYLELLIKQNINEFPSLLVHPFNSTHLKLRIMRIKKQLKTRVNPITVGISILTFGLLFLGNQNLKATNESITNKHSEKKEVDKMPEYPGGNIAMIKFINSNTFYSKEVVEKNIEGKVFMQFKVGTDGTLSEYKLMKAANKELEKMAINILEKMPNWVPGEKDGQKVAVKMVIPFNFMIPPPPPPAPPSK